MGRVVEKIVFDVAPELKRRWMDLCQREGVTQAEMFRQLVAKEDAAMTDVEKMLREFPWETIVHYMDDDIREQLHRELVPCSNEEFLARYLELHREKYGEDYQIN